jgi:hypothetical protein
MLATLLVSQTAGLLPRHGHVSICRHFGGSLQPIVLNKRGGVHNAWVTSCTEWRSDSTCSRPLRTAQHHTWHAPSVHRRTTRGHILLCVPLRPITWYLLAYLPDLRLMRKISLCPCLSS